MERSTGHEKKEVATESKYNNNKDNLLVFYKRWKRYNEIQLNKNNGLEQSKYEKSPTLACYQLNTIFACDRQTRY